MYLINPEVKSINVYGTHSKNKYIQKIALIVIPK